MNVQRSQGIGFNAQLHGNSGKKVVSYLAENGGSNYMKYVMGQNKVVVQKIIPGSNPALIGTIKGGSENELLANLQAKVPGFVKQFDKAEANKTLARA